MKTMQVQYKCHCMAEEVAVEVPTRPEDSDILVWMQVVQGMIGLDHRRRAPSCRADTMEYAKIPMDEGAPGIGIARKTN